MKKNLLLIFFLISISFAQPRQMDGVELQLAVNRLSVVGSVLYVAAHPDDENTALLSYFAKGKLLRTGYLSITRGEGGQNLIGSEQGTELGIIRTQELLAARRIDGAEQFFTCAIDFGYSKSSEEAFADVVFSIFELMLSQIICNPCFIIVIRCWFFCFRLDVPVGSSLSVILTEAMKQGLKQQA